MKAGGHDAEDPVDRVHIGPRAQLQHLVVIDVLFGRPHRSPGLGAELEPDRQLRAGRNTVADDGFQRKAILGHVDAHLLAGFNALCAFNLGAPVGQVAGVELAGTRLAHIVPVHHYVKANRLSMILPFAVCHLVYKLSFVE